MAPEPSLLIDAPRDHGLQCPGPAGPPRSELLCTQSGLQRRCHSPRESQCELSVTIPDRTHGTSSQHRTASSGPRHVARPHPLDFVTTPDCTHRAASRHQITPTGQHRDVLSKCLQIHSSSFKENSTKSSFYKLEILGNDRIRIVHNRWPCTDFPLPLALQTSSFTSSEDKRLTRRVTVRNATRHPHEDVFQKGRDDVL